MDTPEGMRSCFAELEGRFETGSAMDSEPVIELEGELTVKIKQKDIKPEEKTSPVSQVKT